jgi:N-acetylmuramoyl-L-alanine amidase
VKRLLKKGSFILPALLAAAVFFLFVSSPLDDADITAAADAAPEDYTVVIDAGHGGEDGGAVSVTGVKESALNLDIAEKLDLILAFYGVRTVMTRTSEDLDYSENSDTIRKKKTEDQKRRLALIQATENALLISIHQNNYPSGGPFGAQAFFAPTNGSEALAGVLQQLLVNALNPKNKRTAVRIPSNILLMNNVSCPAVLVECGFLSNPSEEKLLRTEEYRMKLAAVIAAGYLTAKDSLIYNPDGGANENQDSFLLYGVRE